MLLVTAGCTGTGAGAEPGPTPETGAGTQTEPAADPTAMPSFDPATAVGDYAPGFPTELLAAPDGATVLASSAVEADDDELVDVSLNLTTELSTQAIIDRFAERLDEAGFTESETVDVSALTVQTAYTRTKGKRNPRVETVLIGVLDDGERRLVSLSGTVTAPTAD